MFKLLPVAPVLLLAAMPAAAQDAPPAATGGERVNQVIVYGDDPCPTSTDDTIVVCGRMDEGERFRIPEQLRGNPNAPTHESWTARVRSVERVGRFGTDSCSTTGIGGFTGCVNQMIGDARAERDAARGTDWTNLVAEERERRMRGFDAQAQAVEDQVARDEAARVAREQATANASEEAAANADPLPQPPATTPPPQH